MLSEFIIFKNNAIFLEWKQSRKWTSDSRGWGLVSRASGAPGPEGTQTWGKALGESPHSHKRLRYFHVYLWGVRKSQAAPAKTTRRTFRRSEKLLSS